MAHLIPPQMSDDDRGVHRPPAPEEGPGHGPLRVKSTRYSWFKSKVPMKKNLGKVSGAAEKSNSPSDAARASDLGRSSRGASGVSPEISTSSEPGSALRAAVLARTEEAVRRVVDDNRPFPWYYGDNSGILSVAVQAGSRDIVEFLLDRGSPVDGALFGSDADTPLVAAVRTGRSDLVEVLHHRGARINFAPDWTDTALVAAARGGDPDMVKLLLDYGADVNQPSFNGDTPLVAAVKGENVRVVKLLFDRGAHFNNTGFDLDFALTVAARTGNVEVAEVLLDRGTLTGSRPASLANALVTATQYRGIELVKLLLDRGAPVDHEDFNRGTPLRIAVEAKNIEMVEVLLDRGADIFNGGQDTNHSPLTAAARIGDQEMVQMLLAQRTAMQGSGLKIRGTEANAEHARPVTAARPDVVALDDAEGPSKADDRHSTIRRTPASSPINLPANSSHPLYGRPLIAAAVNGHKEVARMLVAHGAEKFNDARAENDRPFFSSSRPGSYMAFLLSIEAWLESTRSPDDDPYVSISFPNGVVDETGFILDFDFFRDAMVDSVVWQWEVPAAVKSMDPSWTLCLEDEVAVIAFNLSTSTLGSERYRAVTWAEYLAHLDIKTTPHSSPPTKLLLELTKRISSLFQSSSKAQPAADLQKITYSDLLWGFWTHFGNWGPTMKLDWDSARVELQKPTALGQVAKAELFPAMELLCTALRPPSADCRHNLSSAKYRLEREGSQTDSTSQTSRLRLTMKLGSDSLPEIKDGCWRNLFDSCHILHLSKPMFGCKQPWTAAEESEDRSPHPTSYARGLEMPFDLMVALAAVEYPVVVDGGVVLLGCETALVPTALYHGDSKQGSVAQFHLITNADYTGDVKSDGLLNPYRAASGHHLRTTDSDQFRSMRCFLGWCAAAQLNLGTRHLPARVDYSGGRDTPRSKRLDAYSAMVQLGVNPISPLSVVLGVQTNYKFSSHRPRFTPFSGYATLLRDTAAKTAVVYDASQRRGWLVPVLSLLLHMSHAYALSCGGEPGNDNVPFVEGHGDATELISILEPLGNRPVLGGTGDGANGRNGPSDSTGNHALLLRQLLLGLRTNLLSCSEATKSSEKARLYGFEFTDVITPPDRGACMKSLNVSSAGIAWTEVANAADAVVVCANIGEVITPAESTSRGSSRCNTMPQKLYYLAATVPCLDRLTRRKGSALISATATSSDSDSLGNVLDSTQGLSDEVKMSDNSVWRLHGNPFGSCEHGENDPKSCWERTDLMQRIKSRKAHQVLLEKVFERSGIKRPSLQDMGMPLIPPAGAVVFGKLPLRSVFTTARVNPTLASASRVADTVPESLGHLALCERRHVGLNVESDPSLILSSAAIWSGEGT